MLRSFTKVELAIVENSRNVTAWGEPMQQHVRIGDDMSCNPFMIWIHNFGMKSYGFESLATLEYCFLTLQIAFLFFSLGWLAIVSLSVEFHTNPRNAFWELSIAFTVFFLPISDYSLLPSNLHNNNCIILNSCKMHTIFHFILQGKKGISIHTSTDHKRICHREIAG